MIVDIAPIERRIQRVPVSLAASGDLVAAVAGERIHVLGGVLVAGGAVNITFKSGAAGAALSGAIPLAAAGNGFVVPPSYPGYHWLETGIGQSLYLLLSAGVQVSGFLLYYVG